MTQASNIPVVTIDGPSGSGKGTLACLLAKALGWHILDSGVLYRILALFSLQSRVSPTDEESLVTLTKKMPVEFIITDELSTKILLDGEDISKVIRDEQIGNLASKISAFQSVRSALMGKQRYFRQLPGLVTDGRDMGTLVFPDAEVKLFLVASPEERARRRYNQLKNKGISVTLARIVDEIEQRDRRDSERAVAPLRPAEDSIMIDSSGLTIEDVFLKALDIIQRRLKIGSND